MSVNSVISTQITGAYQSYSSSSSSKKVEDASTGTTAADTGVVYEKSSESATSGGTYSINKMSSEERAALVEQLKADQESRMNQLVSMVQDMMLKQSSTFTIAGMDGESSDSDDIWKFLASGEYTVDEAAKAKAQEEISEDGYWGVKQTSQRLFDFASALAGDDVDKMKKMQEAVLKGYEEATSAWGKELPDISKETLDATNQLFEDYYASK